MLEGFAIHSYAGSAATFFCLMALPQNKLSYKDIFCLNTHLVSQRQRIGACAASELYFISTLILMRNNYGLCIN